MRNVKVMLEKSGTVQCDENTGGNDTVPFSV